MEKQNVDELVTKALEEFDVAMAEYNKPREDVVMYSTCHIIERAIVNFLDAFIIAHDEVPLYGKDILTIQQRCMDFDPSFGKLDFSFVHSLKDHTNDPEGTLLHYYIDALKETRELVMKQLEINEI